MGAESIPGTDGGKLKEEKSSSSRSHFFFFFFENICGKNLKHESQHIACLCV